MCGSIKIKRKLDKRRLDVKDELIYFREARNLRMKDELLAPFNLKSLVYYTDTF